MPLSRSLGAVSRAGLILLAGLSLSGCAAGLGMTMLGVGASTASSAGVSHTLGGIAYKTFTAPPEDVHVAARNALAAMGIVVQVDETDTENGVRHMAGTTKDREISVDVETVTPRTTRLRVVASQDVLFKDSATSTEIIMQTAQALDALEDARSRAATKPVKAVSTKRRKS